MAFNGRIALFVEGSETIHPRRREMMETIWGGHLVQALGLKVFSRLIYISKRDFVAMDPKAPVSGRGVPLPEKIAAELATEAFDAAVVAWDLMPPWRPDKRKSRWEESLLLYESLSKCDALPTIWRRNSKARLEEMQNRRPPCVRTSKQSLAQGEVLSVCMEPTFESVLVICENIIKNMFGVSDGGSVGWPKWSRFKGDPEELLGLAIAAARRQQPTPEPIKVIRGDMRTAKNIWGERILREIIQDEECRGKLRSHPLSLRLMDVLSRDR